MITISDTRLIEKCKKGSARYQKVLYDRYACKIYPICYRYAKNEEDAKDILQETFIRVFNKLETFQDKGSFEGWIKRIAVNVAIRHYQNEIKKIDQHDIERVPELHTDASVLSDLNAEEILRTISELPNGYRIVFNMYALEGYSHKEIAETLNISEGASRSQLTRARQALMEILQPKTKEYVERA